ncbi:hypothetical protein [Nostoc sp.]
MTSLLNKASAKPTLPYLYAIAAHALPTTPSEISKFKQLWEREVLYS